MSELPFPRRNLDCLLLLTLNDDPQTTAELMDAIASLCQSEDLPEELWRGLNGNRMRGRLNALVGTDHVKPAPGWFDPAKGRQVPRWVIAEQIPESWRESVLNARNHAPELASCATSNDLPSRGLAVASALEGLAATLRMFYGGTK